MIDWIIICFIIAGILYAIGNILFDILCGWALMQVDKYREEHSDRWY